MIRGGDGSWLEDEWRAIEVSEVYYDGTKHKRWFAPGCLIFVFGSQRSGGHLNVNFRLVGKFGLPKHQNKLSLIASRITPLLFYDILYEGCVM